MERIVFKKRSTRAIKITIRSKTRNCVLFVTLVSVERWERRKERKALDNTAPQTVLAVHIARKSLHSGSLLEEKDRRSLGETVILTDKMVGSTVDLIRYLNLKNATAIYLGSMSNFRSETISENLLKPDLYLSTCYNEMCQTRITSSYTYTTKMGESLKCSL